MTNKKYNKIIIFFIAILCCGFLFFNAVEAQANTNPSAKKTTEKEVQEIYEKEYNQNKYLTSDTSGYPSINADLASSGATQEAYKRARAGNMSHTEAIAAINKANNGKDTIKPDSIETARDSYRDDRLKSAAIMYSTQIRDGKTEEQAVDATTKYLKESGDFSEKQASIAVEEIQKNPAKAPTMSDLNENENFNTSSGGVFGWSMFTSIINGLLAILKVIQIQMLAIWGWLLWLCGMFLNATVKFGIVEMRERIGSIKMIETGWKFFRDIANISFIFIILYIAIKTIIYSSSFDTKKMLVQTVIVAVLINFSLFFVNIVIDASNVITISLYNQISVGEKNKPNAITNLASQNVQDTINKTAKVIDSMDGGISGKIVTSLGISSFFKNPKDNATDDGINGVINLGITTLGGVILMSIAMFILIFISILITTRYIVIIFLMIFAPLAFIASILPQTQKHWTKWKELLWKQVLIGPALMACLFIAIRLTEGMLDVKDLKNVGLGQAILNGVDNSYGLIWNFVLVSAIYLGAVMIAKEMGATGVSFATGVASKVGFGASKLAMRGSKGILKIEAGGVGKVGSFIANTSTGKRIGGAMSSIANSSIGKGIGAVGQKIGTGASKVSEVTGLTDIAKSTYKQTADANYDVRNLGVAGYSIKDIAKGTGIDMGEALSGKEAAAARAKKAKEEQDIKKQLEKEENKVKFEETSKAYSSVVAKYNEAQEELRLAEENVEKVKSGTDEQKTAAAQKVNEANAKLVLVKNPKDSDEEKAFKAHLKNMSDDQIADMGLDALKKPGIATVLRGRMDKITKDFTRKEKEEIMNAAFSDMNGFLSELKKLEEITTPNDAQKEKKKKLEKDIKNILKSLKDEEVTRLDKKLLTNKNVAKHIIGRLDKVTKEMSEEDSDTIKEAALAEFKEKLTKGDRELSEVMKDADSAVLAMYAKYAVAKSKEKDNSIPLDNFTNQLNTELLEDLLVNGKMNGNVKGAIINTIKQSRAGDAEMLNYIDMHRYAGKAPASGTNKNNNSGIIRP